MELSTCIKKLIFYIFEQYNLVLKNLLLRPSLQSYVQNALRLFAIIFEIQNTVLNILSLKKYSSGKTKKKRILCYIKQLV